MAKSETIAVRVSPETKAALEQGAAASERSLSSYAELVLRNAAENSLSDKRRTIEITDGEKLIIAMLGDLYKHGKVKGEIDPVFVSKVASGGHNWALDWKYSGMFGSFQDSDKVLSEVIDTLDMWDWIEDSVDKMKPAARKTLEDEVATGTTFRGFDGNNEGEHIGVARLLIDDLERFSRFKGRSLNSHMPSVEGYRRMFSTFEPIRSAHSGMGSLLSMEQIKAILQARRRGR